MTYDNGYINLDRADENNNYVQINNADYRLEYLDGTDSKGANSNIFILVNPDEKTQNRVIKICKDPIEWGPGRKIQKRFRREIRAFKLAKEKKLQNVIDIFGNGTVEIDGYTFLYIIMERAEQDLASYLEKKEFNFTINQKLSVCVSILNGVKQLHSLNIYHRDIKHDNILKVGDEFKIGDLGLVEFQNDDFQLDKVNEKIGPFGWLSPEATNKMLTFKKKTGFTYDCDINYKSDIFQLGKLFWYICQGNLPVGQLIPTDYKFERDIFDVLSVMLQYDKSRRPNMAQTEALFKPLKLKYGV
jgi:serine/threonine protein kinase